MLGCQVPITAVPLHRHGGLPIRHCPDGQTDAPPSLRRTHPGTAAGGFYGSDRGMSRRGRRRRRLSSAEVRRGYFTLCFVGAGRSWAWCHASPAATGRACSAERRGFDWPELPATAAQRLPQLGLSHTVALPTPAQHTPATPVRSGSRAVTASNTGG